jgi:type I restriction enzyme S subunit
MNTVTLGEIAAINPDTPITAFADELCPFVPMNAVSEEDAEITAFANRPYSELTNGYVAFTEQDVLVAKITPCMENAKCAIARDLRNGIGFGST